MSEQVIERVAKEIAFADGEDFYEDAKRFRMLARAAVAEIEGLLAAERERCAAVADRWADVWAPAFGGAAKTLAAEIRNLPLQTEKSQS